MLLLAAMCGLNAVGQYQTAQRSSDKYYAVLKWVPKSALWFSPESVVPCHCQSLRTAANLSLRWFNPPPPVHQPNHSGLHKFLKVSVLTPCHQHQFLGSGESLRGPGLRGYFQQWTASCWAQSTKILSPLIFACSFEDTETSPYPWVAIIHLHLCIVQNLKGWLHEAGWGDIFPKSWNFPLKFWLWPSHWYTECLKQTKAQQACCDWCPAKVDVLAVPSR